MGLLRSIRLLVFLLAQVPVFAQPLPERAQIGTPAKGRESEASATRRQSRQEPGLRSGGISTYDFEDESVSGERQSPLLERVHARSARAAGPDCLSGMSELLQDPVGYSQRELTTDEAISAHADDLLERLPQMYRCVNRCYTRRDIAALIRCENFEGFLRRREELAPAQRCSDRWLRRQVFEGRADGAYVGADGQCHQMSEEFERGSFTQRADYLVDVLIVIDASGSMQAAGRSVLTTTIPEIMREALSLEFDVQVNVIMHAFSGIQHRQHQFPVPFPLLITQATEDPDARLQRWLTELYRPYQTFVLPNGVTSGRMQALSWESNERMYAALLRRHLNHLRPDSDLIAIVLTDEPDSSFRNVCIEHAREENFADAASICQNEAYTDYVATPGHFAQQMLTRGRQRLILALGGHAGSESGVSPAYEMTRQAYRTVGGEVVPLSVDAIRRRIVQRLQSYATPGFTSRHILTAQERELLAGGDLVGVSVNGQPLREADFRFEPEENAILFNRPVREDSEFTVDFVIHRPRAGSPLALATTRSRARSGRPEPLDENAQSALLALRRARSLDALFAALESIVPLQHGQASAVLQQLTRAELRRLQRLLATSSRPALTQAVRLLERSIVRARPSQAQCRRLRQGVDSVLRSSEYLDAGDGLAADSTDFAIRRFAEYASATKVTAAVLHCEYPRGVPVVRPD